jgi:hypothetical protein
MHRAPLFVSGVIFSLLALLHLFRLYSGWQLVIGTFSVPLWWSGVGLIITVLLAAWMFNSLRCGKICG